MNKHRRSIKAYEKRFKKVKGIIKIQPPKGKPVDAYTLAYSASLHLLVRTKYLFLSTLEESNKNNAYASYVLVRAFFETCMALGYLAIKLNKKKNQKDLDGIWKLSHRILQGGKYFPGDEFLNKIGREKVPAINIYDFLDEVDTDFRRMKKTNDLSFAPHREVYDTVLSEFGHPNYLGLQICSELKEDSKGNPYEVIFLSRATGKGDKENYLNYLGWGSDIFFYYWDKLIKIFEEIDISLPDIK